MVGEVYVEINEYRGEVKVDGVGLCVRVVNGSASVVHRSQCGVCSVVHRRAFWCIAGHCGAAQCAVWCIAVQCDASQCSVARCAVCIAV